MIFEDIRAKARWLYGSDSPAFVARAWLSDATLSMVLYRAMSWCNKRLWSKPFAFLFYKFNAILCGCVIGVDAQFGRRFIILHSVGVVVNSAVIAGDDVVLESGVVIGAEKEKSPKLGHSIFIGSGAKIIGGITVGDNSLIGANAAVVRNVSSGVVVGGVPARVIRELEGAQ